MQPRKNMVLSVLHLYFMEKALSGCLKILHGFLCISVQIKSKHLSLADQGLQDHPSSLTPCTLTTVLPPPPPQRALWASAPRRSLPLGNDTTRASHPHLTSLQHLGLRLNEVSAGTSLCPPCTFDTVRHSCPSPQLFVSSTVFTHRHKDLESRLRLPRRRVPMAHAAPNTRGYSVPAQDPETVVSVLPGHQKGASHQVTALFLAFMFAVYLQTQLSDIENFSDILVKYLRLI